MSFSTNFELVRLIKTCYGIDVTKYRSKRTGLSVVHIDVEGPLVNGYFVLATEAHDDDGCPHTLEHLVFLGSELYPYKGVLDMLASRALSQGTNAWTDTDNTCYTITTVGNEGFLNLLPIYVDHILYPTLTDSGYVTEVHHINGKGEDAGVLYYSFY
ncbi:8052_t:CDS:2 [Ambispora leptoticha]|uniref:8052_t:CDS:1 n=1 Tax=Ambispora leptoticha TaxID=144679 RepID=A0A9N9AKB3_9GLOM|nr:8052_t:CDS:2 [Ambispora leptoticha]